MTKIAFLGLGAMGSRMAARLLQAGHHVTVWNRTAERTIPLEKLGAVARATPRAAAEGAEIVIAMVRDDQASRAVWLDPEDGAAGGMDRGALALECSTLTVDWTRELGSALKDRGVAMIDAPLAGSRPQAEAGQLIFFAGGPEADVSRAEPVLMHMGAAVHRAGPDVGAGMAIKLMVNAPFGAQVAAVAELLALGERLGVPADTAAAILGETPVASPAAKAAATAMAAGAFAPLFPIDLVEKDFGCVAATAAGAGADVPVTNAVRAVFRTAMDRGYGGDNITGIAQVFRNEQGGVTPLSGPKADADA